MCVFVPRCTRKSVLRRHQFIVWVLGILCFFTPSAISSPSSCPFWTNRQGRTPQFTKEHEHVIYVGVPRFDSLEFYFLFLFLLFQIGSHYYMCVCVCLPVGMCVWVQGYMADRNIGSLMELELHMNTSFCVDAKNWTWALKIAANAFNCWAVSPAL